MTAVVADLGNSRLKWGRIGPDGHLAEVVALPTDDPARWGEVWDAWGLGSGSAWRVASVSPAGADRLAAFLRDRGAGPVRWFRSGADVRIRHEILQPETSGADRALAVAAALARPAHAGRPGVVVSCGTALTVERVGPDGFWQGGAIAPGFGPMARALHLMTAQLPEVPIPDHDCPAAWGRSTRPAIQAGVFWAVVGAARELIARQAADFHDPWLVWTGGDAATVACAVDRPGSSIVPHLVLEGLVGQTH